MRIAVNLRTFFHREIGGLEEIVRGLLTGAAARQRAEGWSISLFAQQTQFEHLHRWAPEAELRDGHDPLVIERALSSESFDLLLCPLLSLEPLAPNVRSVVWIPDLQHEFFPELFEPSILQWRRRSYRASVLHAEAVITLSEYSRSTLIERLGADPERVHVIPPAAREDLQPTAQTPASHAGDDASPAFQQLALASEYLFYPANFWPHKNHETLLRALGRLVRPRPGLELVLTGAEATGAARVREQMREVGVEANVRLLGYVDRSLLLELYRHASIVCYVSRFEGFGIPILEAFWSETPLIVSTAASCPEVAGEAALLVDPDDPEAIAEAIQRLLDDPALGRDLIERGRRRRQQYDWGRSGQQTLQVLEDTVQRESRLAAIKVTDPAWVRIVTPSLNQGEYLRETIDSVLAQDYPRIDYMVMDGGSTDGSREILESYGNRIRYRSEPDGGQADAVNRGFELTKGEFFGFLNADDTYLPGAIAEAVGQLESFPGMAAVYGDARYVDGNGRPVRGYPTRPFVADALACECYICQPATLLRSVVFEELGKLDESLDYALDYDLWLRLVKQYSMLKIDHELATSRMHQNNKTLSDRSSVLREIMRTVRRHHDYVPFSWVLGYAHHRLHPRASFFAPPPAGRLDYLLALVLGLARNHHRPWHFFKEWWPATVGPRFFRNFTGRWPDGWISRLYVSDLWLGDASSIAVEGQYPDFLPPGLILQVGLDGQPPKVVPLSRFGPFRIELEVPPQFRETLRQLRIEANQTHRLRHLGDHRPLACQITSVLTE